MIQKEITNYLQNFFSHKKQNIWFIYKTVFSLLLEEITQANINWITYYFISYNSHLYVVLISFQK